MLKPGDVLTIGGVTLRVDLLRAGPKPAASPAPQAKASDTAEVDALPVAEDDFELEMVEDEDEFEVALDNASEHMDIIPLDDEPPPTPPSKAAKPATRRRCTRSLVWRDCGRKIRRRRTKTLISP